MSGYLSNTVCSYSDFVSTCSLRFLYSVMLSYIMCTCQP